MKIDSFGCSTDHEQIEILIKNQKIRVDKNIVDIIKWLNSYPGIETIFSCCGYRDVFWSPYVWFRCTSDKSFRKIFSIIQDFINRDGEDMSSDVDFKIIKMRKTFFEYCIRWNKPWSIKEFQKFLAKRKR